ncbi:MAG: hypothetical protein KAX80_14485 [Planctomycetes bacterium]|nr:hypothetical protein [Planctomycetota bacterium]
MAKIKIVTDKVEMLATFNESESARTFYDALPIEGSASRWGDEVYFDIGLSMPEENPQAEVPSGTLAYWPTGTAFCIFFGQTPYSPVNVLGTLDGDPKEFDQVQSGETVRLEKVE